MNHQIFGILIAGLAGVALLQTESYPDFYSYDSNHVASLVGAISLTLSACILSIRYLANRHTILRCTILFVLTSGFYFALVMTGAELSHNEICNELASNEFCGKIANTVSYILRSTFIFGGTVAVVYGLATPLLGYMSSRLK